MARLQTTSIRIVSKPTLLVRIDGRTAPEAQALQLSKRVGVYPTTLVLSFPSRYAGGPLLSLHGREVEVYKVATDAGRVLFFRGYIQSDTAEEDPSRSQVTVRAVDAMGLLDRVYFGQAQLRGETILEKDYNGTPSPWSLAAILQLALGPYSLDGNWRSIVRLGDVSALGNARLSQRFPTLRFTGETVLSAIRRLSALVPGMTPRVRYTSTGASIDFFVYAQPQQGFRQVRVPLVSGPEEGAAVTAWARTTGSSQVRTRVVAYADRYRHQVTMSDAHAFPLLGGWGYEIDGTQFPPTPYFDALNPGEEIPTYHPREQDVLDFPMLSTVEIQGIDRLLYQDIFRRYVIPPSLLRVIDIDAANVAPDEEGNQLGVQVFRPVYTYELYTEEDAEIGEYRAARVPGEYELLSASVDPRSGTITLQAPNTFLLRKYAASAGGHEVREYARAPLFVTLTIASNSNPAVAFDQVVTDRSRGGYDTGQRAFSGIRNIDAGTGSVLSFVNSNMRFWTYGTFPQGFVDAVGISRVLGTLWFNPRNETWTARGLNVSDGMPPIEPDPFQGELELDERPILASIAEAAIANTVKPTTEIAVQLPYTPVGWQAGDPLVVLGRSVDGYTFTIAQIDLDFVNNSARVRASDARPHTARLDMQPPTRTIPSMRPTEGGELERDRSFGPEPMLGLEPPPMTTAPAPPQGPVNVPSFNVPGQSRPAHGLPHLEGRRAMPQGVPPIASATTPNVGRRNR